MTALRKTRGRDEYLPEGSVSAQAAVVQIWREPLELAARIEANAAEAMKIVRREQAAATWDAREAEASGDPYFNGGWA